VVVVFPHRRYAGEGNVHGDIVILDFSPTRKTLDTSSEKTTIHKADAHGDYGVMMWPCAFQKRYWTRQQNAQAISLAYQAKGMATRTCARSKAYIARISFS
jgi:hypothetical protein